MRLGRVFSFYLNWKSAVWLVPSPSVSIKRRQLSFHFLPVFQTYGVGRRVRAVRLHAQSAGRVVDIGNRRDLQACRSGVWLKRNAALKKLIFFVGKLLEVS
jgi:hypothetical protein